MKGKIGWLLAGLLLSLYIAGCQLGGDDDGAGACVMHQDEPMKIHKCIAVISKGHCDSEGDQKVGEKESYTYFSGKTCAQLGYKYCEFNGCVVGADEGGCDEGSGTHMYGTCACDNDYPPSDIDCTGGVFEGVWHSQNPNGTVKAHWDFDQCRVISWDATGEICGFHVAVEGFEFSGVGDDQGTVLLSYGTYYNWTLCEPDAHWQEDPTAPKGEQAPISWELKSNGNLNINGENIIRGNGGKTPPGWGGSGAPSGDECGTLPQASCGSF